MTNQESPSAKLIELLAGIDFDKRYYAYYEAHKDRENQSMTGATRETFEAALSPTQLNFKHSKKENFFSYEERHVHCTVGLNVAFPYSTVELILFVKTRNGYVGGPFPKLAREVGQLRDPNFAPSPPSPKLPFSSRSELEEAVRFGVSLFEDAKRAILTYDEWDA